MRKKKQCESNKRRPSIRKQNKSNNEIKQNERKQRSQNVVDKVVDLRRFFVLATSDKNCVTGLNQHEPKSEISVLTQLILS